MRRVTSVLALLVGGWVVAAVSSVEIRAGQAQRTPSNPGPAIAGPAKAGHYDTKALVDQYCITCHNQRQKAVVDAALTHGV